MADVLDAIGLADHLDAINRRVAERGPTPDSAARLAAIVAESEAACFVLRRAEAEAEIDDRRTGSATGP